MKKIHSLTMQGITLAACASVCVLFSACSDGYYDASGRYVSGSRPDYYNGTVDNDYYAHSDAPYTTQTKYQVSPSYTSTTEEEAYTRRGYYDYDGNYVTTIPTHTVPANMFPPRGQCRVWFADRLPAQQPGIESCEGIRSRVPAGAYVIYGG